MLHTMLAAVPQPPTHLEIPKAAETFFTVFLFVPVAGALAIALRRVIARRDPLLLYCLAGGALAALFEPIVDVLGLCYLKENGAIHTFTAFDRTIPLYLCFVYTWYVGGMAYLFYRLFERGITMKGVFGLWALGAIANILDESPGVLLDVYTYYGHQPLDLWGLPLWWIFVNSLMPMIAAALIYKLKPHLTGWSLLVVVGLIPIADGIANAATAWPTWLALNQTDVSYAWTHLAALATIGLAALCVWIVGIVVARPAEQVETIAPTRLPARRARAREMVA